MMTYKRGIGWLAGTAAIVWAAPAVAQPGTVEALRSELAQARQEIAAQRERLDAQEARMKALEAALTQVAAAQANQNGQVPGTQPGTRSASADGVEQVGEAPATQIEMPQVAVLGEQGSVVTRAGRFTLEPSLEYTRADRNRTLFRGIALAETLLIGVFDISESRQDVLTAATSFRYGLSDRLEVGVRVPFVYRSDKSIIAPIPGTTPSGDPSTRINTSADAKGLGDIEASIRYQLMSARRGYPFLIASLQAIAPTGRSAFEVPRDPNGAATEAATGSGFWGITPGITAILPSDPAVLFGSLSYTKNFASDVRTEIPPVLIERVAPGDAIGASLGIGVSLNQRTSLNLGYAHSWIFGTRTRVRLLNPGPNDPIEPTTQTTRDLQLGRFLFGLSHRLSDKVSVNWSVEVGATDDASDIRTVLRIPFMLGGG